MRLVQPGARGLALGPLLVGALGCTSNGKDQIIVDDTSPGTDSADDTESTPVTWADVSISALVACGLSSAGRILCWGDQTQGGNAQAPSIGRYVEVSEGRYHGCALDDAGEAACWGLEGSKSPYDYGQTSPPAGPFHGISAGMWQTCALNENEEIVCWGAGPTRDWVPPAGQWLKVSVGGEVACAVNVDHSLTCWGYSGMAPPPEGNNFVDVDSGEWHACAISDDTKATCWGGYNWDTRGIPGTPYLIGISAGIEGSCGIETDHGVLCWATDAKYNRYNAIERLLPTSSDWAKVSVGYGVACGITLEDTIQCWGSDWDGILTVPAPPE